MKYSVHSIQDKETGDFYHAVFEEETQQVIQFHYFLDDAQSQANFFENGGAFRGFTPSYMLIEVPLQRSKEQLNMQLSRL